MNFFTLGVYGSSEAAFFDALLKSGVDTFCDLRWRRGVRGKEYAFVNSKRLQQRLTELNIRYLHLRELAPPPALRRRQSEADKAKRTAKRQRTALDESFVESYRREILAGFDFKTFAEKLGPHARNVALFCVEREPEACHRSILAQRLQQDSGITVVHMHPG
ncbi:MAG TPA: DUF488 domain-containing protein [Clostridia bacterium]|nr:DUF488 domain-containing protein [Clostridia bacterium]